MKERDYNKWLESKSEIEHFDEIPEKLKEAIYKAEQELEDHEEVELEEIDIYEHEIHFAWLGYDKECQRVADEFGYDTPKQAEEIVDRGGHENMTYVLDAYMSIINNTISDPFERWRFTTL